MPTPNANLTRDEKVENLILNYSMILMSTFEDMFANLASKMSEALVEGTAAMADALAGGMSGTSKNKREAEDAKKKTEEKVGPQVSANVKGAFAELRNQARTELSMNGESLKEFLRNPALDEGVRIVERHDFRLPRITESLTDGDLASYMVLLHNENPEFAEMLQELGEWQKGVPKPWKNK